MNDKRDKPIINTYLENLHAYNGMQHTRYTTSIRNIIYDFFAWQDDDKWFGYAKPDEVIAKGRELIFNFSYPIIDKDYESEYFGNFNSREYFETAFIEKFIKDEIAFESVAEFLMKLQGKLYKVIPAYNAELNFIMNLDINHLWGGYKLIEHTENVHSDTHDTDASSDHRNRNIGSTFPVNYVQDYEELGKITYGTDGNSAEGDTKSKSKTQMDGDYTTDHTAERIEYPNIEKLKQLQNLLNGLLDRTLREFGDLFMGIL